jgi:hypothetical protein
VEGAAACGMCIEVTRVENMPTLHPELTQWDYTSNMTTPFIAMVSFSTLGLIQILVALCDILSYVLPFVRLSAQHGHALCSHGGCGAAHTVNGVLH